MRTTRALAVCAVATAALGLAAPGAIARDTAGTAVAAPHPAVGARHAVGDSGGSGATPADMAIGGALMAVAVVGGGILWWLNRSEDES
ncbi:hypothetical protein AB0C59_28080 [Streptomyces sp. NPDC048664]|uniref:hypothetical protein n=1 Tax=Streptomyces sp. NPDC048664 TaxID=3154505 RepID=UPI003436463C